MVSTTGLVCILMNDDAMELCDPLVPVVESILRYELEYSGDAGRYIMVEVVRGNPLVVSIAYVTEKTIDDEQLSEAVEEMVTSVEGVSEVVVIVNGSVHGTVTV